MLLERPDVPCRSSCGRYLSRYYCIEDSLGIRWPPILVMTWNCSAGLPALARVLVTCYYGGVVTMPEPVRLLVHWSNVIFIK